MNSALLLTASLFGICPCGEPVSEVKKPYVYEPAYCLDDCLRGKPVEYQPQAGDLVFFWDDMPFWHITYRLALTGPPYHVALVFQMPDGEYRLLESGPNDTMYVRLCPMACRLQSWNGRIWIRRRAVPLTERQSRCLTEFALRQDGKDYAWLRLAGQVTMLRSRGPIKSYFMGKSHGERSNYMCAEVVVEALIHIGLFEAANCRPSVTYPQDMFFNRSKNLFLNKHFKLEPGWHPPQRWTVNP
ncbi:MAG: hypothetical protein K8T89_13185 [Planctomycetes bacterium]|nr:hypothetical protein [Planctomycetota bacterium]